MKVSKSNVFSISIVIVFLTIIIVLSYVKFLKYESKILNNIDKELYNSAITISNILNDDFHDRAIEKQSISLIEDSINIVKLSDYNKKTGLKFLYTVIKKDSDFYLTSSSSTDEEIEKGTQVHYFENYHDATPELKKVFDSEITSFFSSSDRWGEYRTVAIPLLSPKGNLYLACADVDISYVKNLLRVNIFDFLIDISILILFIFVIFLFYYKKNKKNTEQLYHEISNRVLIEKELKESHLMLEKLVDEKTFSLKQSETNFQTIFNVIDDLIFVIDKNGQILNVNNTVIERMHYNNSEIISENISSFLLYLDNKDFINRFEHIENKSNSSISLPFKTKENEIIYLEAQLIKSIWDEKEAYFFIAKDVSEIKISEEKFLIAFEANPTAMAISDIEKSMLLDVNEAFENIFGFLREDVKGKSIEDLDVLVNPLLLKQIKGILSSQGTIKNFELDVKHKSGRIIKGIFYADIIIIQGRKCVLMVLNDITERRIAEELLKQKNIEMNALLSSVPAYIYFKDINLNFITVNNAYADMLCVNVDDVTGKTDYDFYPIEVAEKRRSIELDLVLNNKSLPSYEEYIECRDGSKKWNLINHLVYYDKNGNVAGIVGTILDITKIKKTEIELSVFSEELKRSNLELEQFAYIASHDLQEPLRKVIAFGDRLKSKYATILDETGLDYIERMNSASNRMQKMINDLLTYSRISTKANPFTIINLNELFAGVISDLEIQIEKTKAIINVSELPFIEADLSQMTQLMNNLIGNSLKYKHPDREPEINITCEEFNNKIKIQIKDNGIGFEDKFVEDIFQPFYRLHGRSEYEGNGIGLAICKKIVDRHNGIIIAKGIPHTGSTFEIILPLKQNTNF